MKKNKLIYLILATLLFTSCGSESDATATAESGVMDFGAYETSVSSSYDAGEVVAEEAPAEDGAGVVNDEGLDSEATEYKREAMFAKEGWIENILDGKEENTTEGFDERILQVESLVDSYNGYFETANYSTYGGKYFDSTIKVPVKDFQNLYNDLKNIGLNIYNESNVVNETAGYYSLKSRLEVKKLSKERLEELIPTTKSSKDLLKLYDSYFELVAEIETMEARLSQIESSTSYSTIYYKLGDGRSESFVVDDSFMSKIKSGFGTSIDFIEALLIGLAYISVPLILALIIAFFGYKKTSGLLKNIVKEDVNEVVNEDEKNSNVDKEDEEK